MPSYASKFDTKIPLKDANDQFKISIKGYQILYRLHEWYFDSRKKMSTDISSERLMFGHELQATYDLKSPKTSSSNIDANNLLNNNSSIDIINKDKTFVFNSGSGNMIIQQFLVGGIDHNIVSLPDSISTRLAQILANAQDDGQGDTTIKIGQGDTITFAGVSVAQLQKHAGDFVFHA